MEKEYTISCDATLHFNTIAKSKDEALKEAKDEFLSYLKFLGKTADNTYVSSAVEDLIVEEL